MRNLTIFTIFIFLSFSCRSVLADEEPKLWSSAVELGAVFTTGNTEQNNFKLSADAERNGDDYTTTLHADTFQATDNGKDTAQRYYLSARQAYKLNEDDSLFFRVAYDRDKFSGFKQQIDAVAGYQKSLMKSETMSLKTDLGLGARYNEPDTGKDKTELIGRLAGEYNWSISDYALFKQTLSFEIGQDLTTTRSVTSLETSILENISMKLAFALKNNSKAPAGKEKTDTESTVTLVYKF